MHFERDCRMHANQRQSNIELLRLLAIVGIIILHYNNADMGGGFRYVTSGSLNEGILLFLESIAICGVNLFIMISGFFLARTNQRSVGKAIVLLIQVCIFSLVHYVVLVATGREVFSIKGVIGYLIPQNWFVTLYIVLYLISPLLNRAFRNLKSWKVLAGLIFLFSFVPTVLDLVFRITGREFSSLMTLGTNGSGRGYTIVGFVLCYIIGAALNWMRLEKISTWAIWLILLADVILIFLWSRWDQNTAFSYCNPLVVLEAAAFMALFLRMNMGVNRFINLVSESTFSIFLIHLYAVSYLRIEQFVQKPWYVMVLHLLLSCLGIVVFSFVADRIYRLLTNWMTKRLSRVWTYTI